MTINIDDELIHREIVRAFVESGSHSCQSALATAGRKAVESARPELEALLGSIVAELLADTGFRARLRAAMEAVIEDVARVKVTAAAKHMARLQLRPLLKDLTA